MRELRIGYVPLVDAAVPIAAAELGFARRHGLTIGLAREASWATLRDKLVLGHVDAAHLLAPLAIATSLGLGPGPSRPLTAAFTLNLNGNAVTLSTALWHAMGEPGGDLRSVQAAFGAVARARAAEGRPLTLATVFPYSTHTYLLQLFVSGAGLDPERDVRISVVPPPYTADALGAGSVDGFCVGAPWNSVAVAAGTGRIAALGPDLVADAPEKVLAWPRGGIDGDIAGLLVAALKEAAEWCADPEHRPELARLLAEPRHLGLDAALLQRTLEGRLLLGRAGPEIRDPAYLRLGGTLHRPDPAQADWIVARMIASGQVAAEAGIGAAARAVYEPRFFDCP